mgnify:CR=1 FL=1
MKNFIKQYCYLIFPITTIIILTIAYFKIQYVKTIDYDIATIIQISGTLIGFLLTAITIFATIPKNTDYMRRFVKHQHETVFRRSISLGMIFLSICIFIWIIQIPNEFIALLFVLGLEETLFSAYYLYRLCFDNR